MIRSVLKGSIPFVIALFVLSLVVGFVFVEVKAVQKDDSYPHFVTKTFPDGHVEHCVVTQGSIASGGDHWSCK